MGNNRLLDGIKVVELSTFVAAPACGRLLGDMGAKVIKVETTSGCPWRYVQSSFYIEVDEKHNPMFDLYNANKEGIVLDLKNPKAMEVFHKLLAEADVFLTNTRMQSLEKMGLGYDDLKKKYPRLIYAFLGGYGEKGPMKDTPAYDAVAFWTDSGFLSDMQNRGSDPLSSPVAMGDVITGTTLFGGICAALYQRSVTGKGDKVVVTLYGAGIWAASTLITINQPAIGNHYPRDRYEVSPLAAPYRCGDGEYVFLSVTEYERYAEPIFTALGRPELWKDERFDSRAHQSANRGALIKILEGLFLQKTADEWVAELRALGVALTKMTHFTEVVGSEQAQVNDYVFENTYKGGKKSFTVGCPISTEGTGRAPYENAPLLGEHTVKVLQSLGYGDAVIKEMLESKAVRQHD